MGAWGSPGCSLNASARPSASQVMPLMLKVAAEEVTDVQHEAVLSKMQGAWRLDVFAEACEQATRTQDAVLTDWCARVGQREIVLFAEYFLQTYILEAL